MNDDEQKNNEVTDITAVAGKFKSRLELQRYSEKLFAAFKQSVEKLQKLEAENAHLKELLNSVVPSVPSPAKIEEPVVFNVPNEQAIAEIQLDRLKKIAMDRDLTLDETKRMDLLVKNLYLSKNQATKVVDIRAKKIESISEAELIEVVKKSDE